MDRKRPDAGFILTLFTLTIIYIIASGGARSYSVDGEVMRQCARKWPVRRIHLPVVAIIA